MNNLVLLVLLTAITSVAWLNRHAVARTRWEGVQELRKKLSACAAAFQAEHEGSAATDRRLQELRHTARSINESLVQASADAKDLSVAGDPSADGSWPKARDYFYLPKQYLGKLGYGVFHNDGTLSEEAALLFGLTPADKLPLSPDSALWNYRHLFGDQPLLLPVNRAN
jgi:hypothetical protein